MSSKSEKRGLTAALVEIAIFIPVAVAMLGVAVVIELGDALARRRRAAQALLRARLPYRRSAPAWLRSANPQSAFRNPQCR